MPQRSSLGKMVSLQRKVGLCSLFMVLTACAGSPPPEADREGLEERAREAERDLLRSAPRRR